MNRDSPPCCSPRSCKSSACGLPKREYCEEFVGFETNTAVHEVVIPDEYKFRLVKGTRIGGVVKNEEGQPIQGAWVAYNHGGGFFGDGHVTDENGRWKFDDVRPGKEVYIHVKHPDYLSDHFAEMQKAQKVTTAMLRADRDDRHAPRTADCGQSRRSARKAGQSRDPVVG